jgi:hypothetical protein
VFLSEKFGLGTLQEYSVLLVIVVESHGVLGAIMCPSSRELVIISHKEVSMFSG